MAEIVPFFATPFAFSRLPEAEPLNEELRALFIAHGEAVKKGRVVEPFENVSIYGMLAEILGLTPAPNDGDPSIARAVLR